MCPPSSAQGPGPTAILCYLQIGPQSRQLSLQPLWRQKHNRKHSLRWLLVYHTWFPVPGSSTFGQSPATSLEVMPGGFRAITSFSSSYTLSH